MFVRIKKSGKHRYLQIVKNERYWHGVHQTVVASLGNLDKYNHAMDLFELGHSFIVLYQKLNPKPAAPAKKKKAA